MYFREGDPKLMSAITARFIWAVAKASWSIELVGVVEL
jgi:hypothetical protein